MKVLFIGGTGLISTACTKLAAERGVEMFLLNRGQRSVDLPPGVKHIAGDIRKPDEVAKSLAGMTFDCAVDWICYTPEQASVDLQLLKGKVGQFIFISSASAYQKPLMNYLITENTPMTNPFWEYSRNKIACEEFFLREFRENKFPATIVRPSHTYGPTTIPSAVSFSGKSWTLVDRIQKGKPIIVHGDGSSLWVLTHNSDFAKGFVPLLGNGKSIGQAFHITSDEVLNWNQIIQTLGKAIGAEPKIVHIPSDFIVACHPETRGGLLGDKAWSVVFDNSKIKRFVPDYVATTPVIEGFGQCLAWLKADAARQVVDDNDNKKIDELIAAYQKCWPGAKQASDN